MQNITKLSIWPDLVKLGFERVNFRFRGELVAVGCSDGNITIEPHSYSDRKNYHISGHVKTPYMDTFFEYDFCGRKVERPTQVTFINNHFKANQILTIVNKIRS